MGVIKISAEDRKLIAELYDKYNKSVRIQSKVLTDLYNRVTGENLTNTTCGSCLRQRLFKLVNLIDKAKDQYRERLSEEDIEFIKWADNLPTDHYPDFDKVVDIHNKVFQKDNKYTNCLPCVKQMFSDLKDLI